MSSLDKNPPPAPGPHLPDSFLVANVFYALPLISRSISKFTNEICGCCDDGEMLYNTYILHYVGSYILHYVGS